MRLQAVTEGGKIRLYHHFGTAPGPFQTIGEDVEVVTTNYSGHRFTDFYVTRSANDGPGWYVFGRNSEKFGTRPDGTGAYVILCGRPDVKPRRHPHYNGEVRRGWPTKREAEAVAAEMNRAHAAAETESRERGTTK